MTTFIQFAILGLGIGSIYSLLAQGVVLIYRGAGIINFAHGTVAMTSAFVFYELHVNHSVGVYPAVAVSVVVGAVLGAVIYQVIMRPLRSASPIVRLVAVLAVLIILQAAATLRYKGTVFFVQPFVPHNVYHSHGVTVPEQSLVLFGISAMLTIVLWALTRFTMFGHATAAVVEDSRAASSLGWSPHFIASANWCIGSALAGLAGVLVTPITGLAVTNLTLIVIFALAAALVGKFQSFPLTFIGATVIGIVITELSYYVKSPGWPDAVPFLIILVVLTLRGESLPLRTDLMQRLPRVGDGVIRPWVLAPACIILFAVSWLVLPTDWVIGVGVLMVSATFLLSIVVLTGYTGQLSLAQFALGGIGAYIAGRLVVAQGWPMWAAIVVALAAAVPVGVLFSLPALRTRGVNLAVLTLGMGLAVYEVLFSNTKYTGGFAGTQVGALTLFNIDFDPIKYPKRFTTLTIVVFVLLALAVANLRRSRSGRRLLAVRTNERAAASIGVSVVGAKMYSFALSSFIAAAAGIMLAFSNYSIVFTNYDPLSSINLVGLAVIGGLGYLAGPVLGGMLASGSIGAVLGFHLFGSGFSEWLQLISGGLIILTLITQRSGIAPHLYQFAPHVERLIRKGERLIRKGDGAPNPTAVRTPSRTVDRTPVRVKPAELHVSDLSVTFGSVRAVDGLSLGVGPGEIVGLIGPNGAGKSTLVDAVTGFVRGSGGAIRLGEVDVTRMPAYRRTRAGLGRSFQSLELFDDLSVRDNLRAASDTRDRRAYLVNLFSGRNQPMSSAGRAVVTDFDLIDELDRKVEELSAGRRRLVAIARSVAGSPSVLLLDEPAAGLDEHETAELGALITALARDWGIGVLLIEHDMSLVMGICDRVVVIEFGKKIAEGVPSEVRVDPNVIRAYLGEEEDDSDGSEPGSPSAPAHTRMGSSL